MIKDYQAENYHLLVKLEQCNLDVSKYTRMFNDYHSFWKTEISEKYATYFYIMVLRSRPLRADIMSPYSIGKLFFLLELKLHVARSNLCRLPATSRGDTQRQAHRSTGQKTFGSSKSSWKGQNKRSEGGQFQSFDKSNRSTEGAFGCGGHEHGNSSLGQKRKLCLHEQKKMNSWIKAKQKLSPAEFQQWLKTSSCINRGE